MNLEINFKSKFPRDILNEIKWKGGYDLSKCTIYYILFGIHLQEINMKNFGLIYAILASVTWGLVYVIAQKVLTKVPPITLLLTEFIIAAIILLPIAFFNLDSIKSLDKTTFILIAFTSIMMLVANFLIITSVKLLGAPIASTLEISYPFFVVLFAYLFFRTPINLYFLLGAIFIFVGSLIIIKLE